MESSHKVRNSQWQLGEHVDCLDPLQKWCNAEIVKVF